MPLTVDDILGARRSLRERAIAAHRDHERNLADELEAEADELEDEAYSFCVSVLGLTAPELMDVQFVHGKYNVQRALVSFALDGLDFQARYKLEKIMEKKSAQFPDGEPIYDKVLAVEFRTPGSTAWRQISSLSELGEKLAK